MDILIAEDDAVTRRRLVQIVRQLGHQPVAAADGAEALALFKQRFFPVVLTDWMMPRLDGDELCRHIRARTSDGRYPYLVLCTALADKAKLIDGIRAGADDYLCKPLDRDLLAARLVVAERIAALHERLHAQHLELKQLNHELFEHSRVDTLTGIANRLRMSEDLSALLALARRHERPFCVGLCDVDQFKLYNDVAGHQAGDLVLRQVAQELAAGCRESDEVYRYGGEEFLVLLPETDLEGGRRALERLCRAVEALATPHPGLPPGGLVTISAGVACWRPGDEICALLDAADSALYLAKASGRNSVAVAEVAVEA